MKEVKNGGALQEKKEVVIDWEKAERVDAQVQYINRGELLFVNFNLKGYNKNKDVKYALSENELFLEVREQATQKVHKLCKTLFKPVVPSESSVQLLVDFIVITLKKAKAVEGEDEVSKVIWDQLGYDVSEFTKPAKIDQLRSNFLKTEAEIEMDKASKEQAKVVADKENVNTVNETQSEMDDEDKIDESKLTDEQKLELAKEREDE